MASRSEEGNVVNSTTFVNNVHAIVWNSVEFSA